MKFIFLFRILIFTILIVNFTGVNGQSNNRSTPKILPDNKILTIIYQLKIEGINKGGIEETYNGGNKTIFISNENIRIRLVSLMRIESIFLNLSPDSGSKMVTIVKESGKDKYKSKLCWNDWKGYNKKYIGVHCIFSEETRTILNYPCKKATLKLIDGKELIVYYTSQFYSPLLAEADPIFSKIPGLVLQYQYKRKNKSITYTAFEINENKINKNLFLIPDKDCPVKNFRH